MYKKIILTTLCLGLATTGLLADQETPKLNSPAVQIVKEAEAGYQSGKYKHFLEAVQVEFERAGNTGLVGQAHKALKGSSAKFDEVSKKSDQLMAERNQKLLVAVEGHDDLAITEKVKSIAAYAPAKEEGAALKYIEKLIYKTPTSKEMDLEEKIAAIEFEYFAKTSFLGLALGQKEGKKLNEDKRIALQLEKLDKMEKAVAASADETWKKRIQLARQGFEAHYIHQLEMAYFKDLAIGVVQPQNDVEGKVKEIMIDYLAKRKELTTSASS